MELQKNVAFRPELSCFQLETSLLRPEASLISTGNGMPSQMEASLFPLKSVNSHSDNVIYIEKPHNFSKNSFRNTIIASNSLDPDQT